jgi:hypothetical protein
VSLLPGIAAWFVGTVAFRLAGRSVLDHAALVGGGGLFVVVGPAMFTLAMTVYG